MGNDSRQHGFEVERGADRLTDLAQRLQLTDRLHQLARPCFEFLEQPNVLDGNHGLVREYFEKGDLLIRERPHLRTANHNSSNRNILSEQRRSKYSMSTCNLLNLRGVRELRFKLCRKVMHVHCFPVEHSSSSECSTSDRSLHRHDWH